MNEVLRALRAMAWERVKGELRSLSAGDFAPQHGSPDDWQEGDEKGNRRDKMIEDFIKAMEDEGLYA